jgi:glutaredoxin 3
MQHELVLYQYDTCPFCRRVTRFMAKHGLDIPMRDTLRDPQARTELMEAGGKSQVPALMIDGRVLYESRAIIAWMEENLVGEDAMRTA